MRGRREQARGSFLAEQIAAMARRERSRVRWDDAARQSYGQCSYVMRASIWRRGLVKRLSAQVQRSAQSRVSEMWSRNDDFGLEQSHGDRVLMFLRPMH